jgi:hypothetical protein
MCNKKKGLSYKQYTGYLHTYSCKPQPQNPTPEEIDPHMYVCMIGAVHIMDL